MPTPELLPCPFCGIGDIGTYSTVATFTVECQSCNGRMVKSDQSAAIEQWNTRPPVVTDEVVERVARAIIQYTPAEYSWPEEAILLAARAAIASMPAVVSGGQGA